MRVIIVHDRKRQHMVFVSHIAEIEELQTGHAYQARIGLVSGDSIHCDETFDNIVSQIKNATP